MLGPLMAVLAASAAAMADPAASQPAAVSPGANRPLASLVEAEIRADRTRFPVNSAIPLEFILRNKTAEFVELSVSLGALADKLPRGFELSGMGLPIEHVFSGEQFRALSVAVEGDPYLGDRVVLGPSRTIPSIVLAPFAQIGLKFDITRYYPYLQQAGKYELRWRPYAGEIQSRPLILEVRVFRQVMMETDAGRLTFRLLYDKAPQTVDRFLSLVEQRFYDGLTFFRIDPALAVQAGCPKGDGTGRAKDGRTLGPEFNGAPFTLGTVGMSLSRTSGTELDVNSASCQFFVCMSRVPVLDGRYTAFAQVEGPESMETLRKIAATPRGANGLPVTPVRIRTATAVDAPIPPVP